MQYCKFVECLEYFKFIKTCKTFKFLLGWNFLIESLYIHTANKCRKIIHCTVVWIQMDYWKILCNFVYQNLLRQLFLSDYRKKWFQKSFAIDNIGGSIDVWCNFLSNSFFQHFIQQFLIDKSYKGFCKSLYKNFKKQCRDSVGNFVDIYL